MDKDTNLEQFSELKDDPKKEFKAILFMDKEIDCIVVDGEPRVIINSVIEAIGLDYKAAHKHINNDVKLSQGSSHETTPNPKYQGQKVKTFNLKFFLVWLMKIDASNANPETRIMLEAFQDDAYDVLFDFFFKKQKEIAKSMNKQFSIEKRIKRLKDRLLKLETAEMKEIKREIKLLESDKKKITKDTSGILELDFNEPSWFLCSPFNKINHSKRVVYLC